ncbi:hypothetical protein L9F63_010026, partial [Diploptera punctata]
INDFDNVMGVGKLYSLPVVDFLLAFVSIRYVFKACMHVNVLSHFVIPLAQISPGFQVTRILVSLAASQSCSVPSSMPTGLTSLFISDPLPTAEHQGRPSSASVAAGVGLRTTVCFPLALNYLGLIEESLQLVRTFGCLTARWFSNPDALPPCNIWVKI